MLVLYDLREKIMRYPESSLDALFWRRGTLKQGLKIYELNLKSNYFMFKKLNEGLQIILI